jgi:deoxyadenosine/deoxycytidine kinase
MKIIFDGNISSGKSDSLNYFSNQLHMNVLIEQHANIACSTMSNAQNALLIEQPKQSLGSTIKEVQGTSLIEPVDKWSPGLELFYKDKTNAFTLQMEILLWHLQNKNETGFIERSPLSCVHVFGESLRKDNLISEYQWTIMNEYYTTFGWKPDIIFYLQCPPEICFERLKNRNRNCETNISLEYLTKIHENYEILYNSNNILTENINIVKIDASQSKENVSNSINEYLNKFCL